MFLHQLSKKCIGILTIYGLFQSAKIASSAVVNETLITCICKRETIAHMQLHFSDPYFQCVLEINFGGSVSQLLIAI